MFYEERCEGRHARVSQKDAWRKRVWRFKEGCEALTYRPREFAGLAGQVDAKLGFYRSLFIGHVLEDSFRENGTSGGVITWLLTELLNKKLVDFVIHVRKQERSAEGKLFKFAVSASSEAVIDGAKSRYYPVEMSEVMQSIKQNPGRYVFVGLPCYVKAVRRLVLIDPIIKERVIFCVGLVCGHLKSTAFAKLHGRKLLSGEILAISERRSSHTSRSVPGLIALGASESFLSQRKL